MKRIIAGGLLVSAVAALPPAAAANTAPHWTSHGINCSDCHPAHMGPKTDCLFCHNNDSGSDYSATSAPRMADHSSAVMDSDEYGVWSRDCLDCHDPHVSPQCDTPIVTGNFTSSSPANGTTTFVLDQASLIVFDPSWNDPADWPAKSGPERGLIFVVESMLWDDDAGRYIDFSAEILAADGLTVTVMGEISRISPVNSFNIVYGQYLRTAIDGRAVSYNGPADLALDESGSGTDPTPRGVCQVCHTRTRFWRNDGSRASHFNTENCLTCHEHELGFRPSCNGCHGYPPLTGSPDRIDGLVWTPEPTGATGAGAHAVHVVDNGMACAGCHEGGMPESPVVDDYRLQMGFSVPGLSVSGSSYDGQLLASSYAYEGTGATTVTTNGSMSCIVYCHSDGTSVATASLTPLPSPSWVSGSTDCSSCHGYPPTYGQDDPKSNSHLRHIRAGLSCETCHSGTTLDGVSILATGRHGNGEYDVVGAPVFSANGQDHPLDLVYHFDAGGGSCSVNSCHGYFGFNTPIRWGNISLYASPSIGTGAAANEVTFQVNVTQCGDASYTCREPFTCTFDWGDGSRQSGSCTASHIYPAPGDYLVRWNVRDANNHSLEADKTTPVRAEDLQPAPDITLSAAYDPQTGIVTATIPPFTASGVPVAKVYIYWGDRTRTVMSPPIQPAPHSYGRAGTYGIRVVVYDENYGRITYTADEEPTLSVTVGGP